MKEFHLGDILSVLILCPISIRGVDGMLDILDFMTGEKLDGCELPMFTIQCRTSLLNQLPQLNKIDISELHEGNGKEWIAKQVAKYGESLVVEPLSLVH